MKEAQIEFSQQQYLELEGVFKEREAELLDKIEKLENFKNIAPSTENQGNNRSFRNYLPGFSNV
ncbi:MAG: hypothetical protein GY821_08440 [Gammaproteobacteria bacterium]|nr:hypothetical protein [Gammaproteobacteria bacterium]